MYCQLDISIKDNTKNVLDDDYEVIIIHSNYISFDIKSKITNINDDLYDVNINKKIISQVKKNIDELITPVDSNYDVCIGMSKYIGNDIKYSKNNNSVCYRINLLILEHEEEKYLIGIEYNGNKYYMYKNNINNYTKYDKCVNINTVGEIVLESFKYIFIHKSVYNNTKQNYYLINTYDYNYKKKYIYNNEFPYMFMYQYQSAMFKFNLIDVDNKDDIHSCTFLPINKVSYSNLFYIYQLIFKVLDNSINNNMKTFTNPRNKEYFGNNFTEKETNIILKPRLYVSKYDKFDSLYFRKTDIKNIYNIHILVNNQNRIIGIKYGNTEYFIWKNNGDLTTYELYNKNTNYIKLLLNTFKDALMFLFKIY